MAAAVMRVMTFGSPSSSRSSAATNGSGSGNDSRGRSSERDAVDHHSARSTSRSGGVGAALAKTLSLDLGSGHSSSDGSAGAGGGEALSRTSSRLVPAAAMPVGSPPPPPPPSILLNPTSPSEALQDPTDSNATTPRPTLTRLPSDASSSAHSHGGATTPVSPTFSSLPTGAAGVRGDPRDAGAGEGRPRQSTIRFAPLPQIRPRSYSTGRNVWVVDEDDGAGTGGQQRTRLVRVGSDVEYDGPDGAEGDLFDWSAASPYGPHGGQDDEEEEDDDDDDATGRGGGLTTKWGSWSDTLSSGMWGLAPSTSRRSNLSADEDAVSLSSSSNNDAPGSNIASGASSGGSSKLLKAFGLGGRTKSSKKKRLAAGGGGSAGGGNADEDLLARTSSGESQRSRRSSADVVSHGASPVPVARTTQGRTTTTGIPLRKSSTWEVGDAPAAEPRRGGGGGSEGGAGGPVYYASPARSARRRANYPPVAQRSRRGQPVVKVEEPKFSEWGGAGVGSRARPAGARTAGNNNEDEDDGSGMAWLKKRRLEREKAEREKAEWEAREAEEHQRVGSEGPREQGTAGEPRGEAEKDSAAAMEADGPDAAGRRTPSPPPPSSGLSTMTAQSLPLPSQLETFRRARQPPNRSGTLDSTLSSTSTIRPSTPTQPSATAVLGGLSATRPALVVQISSQPSSSTASLGSDDTPITSSVGDDDDDEEDNSEEDGISSDEDEEEEEEEEEEEDGRGDGQDEDDEDLDEEELAREEELAEEARRSAKSMGAERYHSSQHECEVKVVAPDS